MNEAYLALVSAVFFGMSSIVIRMGMMRGLSRFNSVFTFSFAAVLIWLFVIITGSALPDTDSWIFFILAGMSAPGISAMFNFESLKRIGVAFTAPLIATAQMKK